MRRGRKKLLVLLISLTVVVAFIVGAGWYLTSSGYRVRVLLRALAKSGTLSFTDQLSLRLLGRTLGGSSSYEDMFGELVGIGPAAVGPLIAALKDDDFTVRAIAAHALGEIGDRRAVGPLIESLRIDSWPVTLSAAQALGDIGDPRAVVPLITALGDSEADIREHAAEALGKLGDSRAIEPIEALFANETESGVRDVAALALVKLRYPVASKTYPELAKRLAWILPKSGLVDSLSLEDRIQFVRDAGDFQIVVNWAVLRGAGVDKDTKGPLNCSQMSFDMAIRGVLTEAGKNNPLDYALEASIIVISTKADLQSRLVRKILFEALLTDLKDSFFVDRIRAAAVLGQLGDERSIEPLRRLLNDNVLEVRQAAAEAIEKIRRKASGSQE